MYIVLGIVFILLSIGFTLLTSYATTAWLFKWYGFAVFLWSIIACVLCGFMGFASFAIAFGGK